MSVLKGDFLGFTFNGIHSSELGIFRVSDGSRYTENLLPTIQDKTTQFPGADGMYYYGSYYTQRQISFSIAFDGLTDTQIRKIKVLFSDKKPHDLIFDEAPYKVYKVKVTGTPNLKYVPFDQAKDFYDRDYAEYGATVKERIYKGEGQLSFTAYSPFARSRFKYLDDYTFENIPEWGMQDLGDQVIVNNNIEEWKESSRLINRISKQVGGTAYLLDEVQPYGVLCYNGGDLTTPFLLDFFIPGQEVDGKIVRKLENGLTIVKRALKDGNIVIEETPKESLGIDSFTLVSSDAGIRINSKLHLIEGIDNNGNSTGVVYNQYILTGDFFKLQPSEDVFFIQIGWVKPGVGETPSAPGGVTGTIAYNYLYY